MESLGNVDLYELLQVVPSANLKEIKTAYRKKALSCHPDKNPDNPKAAELFQQLSKALEILTDEAARAAYDQLINAKKAKELRNRDLDSKRRKLKEDLEAREQAFQEGRLTDAEAAQKLQEEIERLRKEGSKQLEEERELLRKKIIEERKGCGHFEGKRIARLKARWKVHKSDESNGGYSQDLLTKLFSKYGDVTCVALSNKKKGSALIEFSSVEEAHSAFQYENGLSDNPLTMKWIQGQPDSCNKKGPPPLPPEGSAVTSRDYESLVLMKMRQAEERKKLIQQMMEEDQEDT